MIRNIQKSIASQRVRAFMRVLFGVFLFLYFYFLQSPLLELIQFQLSEGRTTYHRFISSLILSVILVGLQRLVTNWIRYSESLYFVSYLPSAVLAISLTAFLPTMKVASLLFLGVASLFFILASIYSIKQKTPHDRVSMSYAELITVHAVGMIGVLFSLGVCSNAKDVEIFENKTAHYICLSDFEQALNIGRHSLKTSDKLTALRVFAMANSAEGVGNQLFLYPMPATGAEQLLLRAEDSLSSKFLADSLYMHFQSWRSSRESALDYFHRQSLRNDSSHLVRDYWLGALLLEKRLDVFEQELSRYYEKKDSVALPKYYQEALFLHSFETMTPMAWNIDSSLIKSYYVFKAQEGLYADSLIRANQMRRRFGDTYWWYYHYQH